AELWASTSLATPIADAERNQVAIELRAGASRRFTDRIDGFIAGGVGLDNGFGIPDWRALAGVRFEVTTGEPQRVIAVTPVVDPRTQDTDGDGIAAASDRCVDQPEDKDGFQDDDGCADAPATIDGRVVDAGGRPIAGATVTIAQLESARAKPIELTSDADGRFTTQLDGGALELTARAGDYKDGAAKLTVAPGTTGAATVTLARAVRAGQLRGQVLAFDGKPLAATITVKGKTTATTATDADGQYTLELPEGAFAVEISSADHVTQKRNVTIKLDGVTVLNVDLRRTK
ncbi:MAG TPA: carboxypeptidase-like regulatory domain-containing protein, partial [Kofleriaceae bacterium]